MLRSVEVFRKRSLVITNLFHDTTMVICVPPCVFMSAYIYPPTGSLGYLATEGTRYLPTSTHAHVAVVCLSSWHSRYQLRGRHVGTTYE